MGFGRSATKVSKTRNNTKSNELILLTIVCLRTFVLSWQKLLTDTFVYQFSHNP